MTPSPLAITKDGVTFDFALGSEDRGYTFIAGDGSAVYAYGFGSSDCSSLPYKTGSAKLWKTTDGTSWLPVTLPSIMQDKAPTFFFDGANALFLEGATIQSWPQYDCHFSTDTSSAYRSTDGGLNWTEITEKPWDADYVGPFLNASFGGRDYLICGWDEGSIPYTTACAYESADGAHWLKTDIIPDSDERVASMAVMGGQLYAIAESGTWAAAFPKYGYGSFQPAGGSTVWRTSDGQTWKGVSAAVPMASTLVSGGGLLFAVRLGSSVMEPVPGDAGIYYSAEGSHWSVWQQWPPNFVPTDLGGNPLLVYNGALYLAVYQSAGPGYSPVFWKIPLTDFMQTGVGTIVPSRNPIAAGQQLALAAPAGDWHQWRRNGISISDSPMRVVGTTGAALLFSPVEEADSGIYTCLYQNGSGVILETQPFIVDPQGRVPLITLPGAALLVAILLAAARRALRWKFPPAALRNE
jgi:hypothetical protein